MGISGFHSATKHYLRQAHLQEYRGKTLGIDASAWLHRGAVPYAWQIFNDENPWENVPGAMAPWIEFPLRMVRMLQSFDIQPVLVFDGCPSPAKAPTSTMRRERKEKAKERAKILLQEGRQFEASKHLQQALDITRQMARELIVELVRRNIRFVVAPYEADAQLAYLAMKPVEHGGVDAVITEDSDLVAYGCVRILFKCNVDGFVEELRREDLFGNPRDLISSYEERQCSEAGGSTSGTTQQDVGSNSGSDTRKGGKRALLSFEGWTEEQLILVCVLAGCDFLPSLKGMGFKTAHGIVAKGKTVTNTLRYMRQEKRWQRIMSNEYIKAVQKACECFKYALVFDIVKGQCTHLRPLPDDVQKSDMTHLGPQLEEKIAIDLAAGRLNPENFEKYPLSEAEKQKIRVRGMAFVTIPRKQTQFGGVDNMLQHTIPSTSQFPTGANAPSPGDIRSSAATVKSIDNTEEIKAGDATAHCDSVVAPAPLDKPSHVTPTQGVGHLLHRLSQASGPNRRNDQPIIVGVQKDQVLSTEAKTTQIAENDILASQPLQTQDTDNPSSEIPPSDDTSKKDIEIILDGADEATSPLRETQISRVSTGDKGLLGEVSTALKFNTASMRTQNAQGKKIRAPKRPGSSSSLDARKRLGVSSGAAKGCAKIQDFFAKKGC